MQSHVIGDFLLASNEPLDMRLSGEVGMREICSRLLFKTVASLKLILRSSSNIPILASSKNID
jgi:hypothetical protein